MQILPQALQQEPGVLVQQTTTAQGSPFIRGFSAQRLVYLLDGVRFNTSTFRAGATQYLGWINPGLVDRIEVVRGPASVQYGSDALGGTINVLASRPPFNPSGTAVSGSVERAPVGLRAHGSRFVSAVPAVQWTICEPDATGTRTRR